MATLNDYTLRKLCEFCRIASGLAPASIVYENRNLMAFMDLHPANVGHVLVIPREHLATIYEAPEDILAQLFMLVKRVAVALRREVRADGISILQFNEAAAGQSVGHLHVHIIPRFKGDAISRFVGAMLGSIGFEKAERQSLDEMAEKIKEKL